MYPGIPELPFGNSQVPGVNLYFKVNLLYAVIIKGTVDVTSNEPPVST